MVVIFTMITYQKISAGGRVLAQSKNKQTKSKKIGKKNCYTNYTYNYTNNCYT